MDTPTAKSEIERICTVSGLPVLSKPEWTHVALDSDYWANMSVIGNHIIYSTPVGFIRLQSGKKTLDLIDRIIAEAVPENQRISLLKIFPICGALHSTPADYSSTTCAGVIAWPVLYF